MKRIIEKVLISLLDSLVESEVVEEVKVEEVEVLELHPDVEYQEIRDEVDELISIAYNRGGIGETLTQKEFTSRIYKVYWRSSSYKTNKSYTVANREAVEDLHKLVFNIYKSELSNPSEIQTQVYSLAEYKKSKSHD